MLYCFEIVGSSLDSTKNFFYGIEGSKKYSVLVFSFDTARISTQNFYTAVFFSTNSK